MASTAEYVVIETRDPFARADMGASDALIDGLARGAATTVVLAQNAVLGARGGSAPARALSDLASRARVVADDFALRERGIRADELAPGIGVTTMDELVELIAAPGRKVLWR